jgi:hypothetical protein
MAVKGTFIASSGRMVGTVKERKYEYEVIQVDREDGKTISESEKDKIDRPDIQEGDRIFFKITGGHLGDEVIYRWVAGPYPTIGSMEEAIEDMMLYGSP